MEVCRVRISRKHVQAFKDELNWIGSGLIIAAGFAAAMPVLIPFAWLAYEAAYMLFVPDSAWYERRLSRKFDAEVVRRRQGLRRRFFPFLLSEDKRRYESMERMRREIEAQQTDAGTLQREMLRKLDFLMERFLQFGSKRAEYLEYLRGLMKQELGIVPSRRGWWGGPEAAEETQAGDAMLGNLLRHYRNEIDRLQQQVERERAHTGGEILRKNIQVLEQCQTNAAQIGEILRNVTQQMDLVFDTFTLINGQARTRPPEQMLTDVQDVVGSSEALTEALQEFAPLDQAVQQLGRNG
jgi:hypothetical protein